MAHPGARLKHSSIVRWREPRTAEGMSARRPSLASPLPRFLQYDAEAVEKPEVEETSRTVQCRMYGTKRVRGVYRAELDSDFKER